MDPFWIVTAAVWFLAFIDWIGYSGLARTIYDVLGELLGVNQAKQLREAKTQVLKVRHEMNSVSAMDEFAKWARLKRQLDKHGAEFERLLSAQTIGQASFEVKVQLALRAIGFIFHAYLVWSYFGIPMFHLPAEWGGPVGSMLSLPNSPAGTVSMLAWLTISRTVAKRFFDSSAKFEQNQLID